MNCINVQASTTQSAESLSLLVTRWNAEADASCIE